MFHFANCPFLQALFLQLDSVIAIPQKSEGVLMCLHACLCACSCCMLYVCFCVPCMCLLVACSYLWCACFGGLCMFWHAYASLACMLSSCACFFLLVCRIMRSFLLGRETRKTNTVLGRNAVFGASMIICSVIDTKSLQFVLALSHLADVR